MSPRRPPRVYFSLRSPFSWMALRRLEERFPNAQEIAEFIPFSEPDAKSAAALQAAGGEFHYVAMSKAKHLYILNDTKRLAATYGYAMKWPIDKGDEWWDLPHLAWFKARELGVHRAYYDAVMAARWERGENICDPAILRRVCDEAGLDGALLVAAPDEEHIREQGVEALMRIYEDDVFGVPYFKFGRHRFWGLDRLDGFLAALEEALAPAGTAAPAAADPLAGIPAELRERRGSMDHDTAGGCG